MARALLPSFALRDHGVPNDVNPGLLPQQPAPGPGDLAPNPAIDQAQDLAPLVGFFLSLTLTFLCFWRLALFTTAALKYQWQRPQWGWPRAVCFWWLLPFLNPDDDEAAAEEAAAAAAAYARPGGGAAASETTGLLRYNQHQPPLQEPYGGGGRGRYGGGYATSTPFLPPPPPRALVRKILFHLALFLSVAVDLPAWSVLVYSSIADDSLFDGGTISNPVKWPKTDPAPILLYLLHLLAFFFLFVAMSIVLDMWLTVAEFDARRHLKIWRGFAVAALTTFLVLWAWVVADAFPSAVTPHDVARTRAGVVLALYAAASLLLLAIAFLVAGCLIQHRIISVFSHHPGESFAWVNLLALARLNAVTLTCLLCFLLRAVDLAMPSHRGRDFFRAFTICDSPPNGWGIVVCYGRWALHALPVLALLYIMRHSGESQASVAAAHAAHAAAARGARAMRRRGPGLAHHRHHHYQRRRPAAPLRPPGGGSHGRYGVDGGDERGGVEEGKKPRSQRQVSFQLPGEEPLPPPSSDGAAARV